METTQQVKQMYYYNVIVGQDKKQQIIPLSKDEYANAVSELVDNFEFNFGNVDVTTPIEISYYERGFFLSTEDELSVVTTKVNYYQVSITAANLKINKITQQQYEDIASNVDGFNRYRDKIKIKGTQYDVICYWEGTSNHTVDNEGFYIVLENQELSTFEWVRTFGGVYDS